MNTKQEILSYLHSAATILQQAIVKIEQEKPLLETLSLTLQARENLRCADRLIIQRHVRSCIMGRKNMHNGEKIMREFLLAMKTASKNNIHILS